MGAEGTPQEGLDAQESPNIKKVIDPSTGLLENPEDMEEGLPDKEDTVH